MIWSHLAQIDDCIFTVSLAAVFLNQQFFAVEGHNLHFCYVWDAPNGSKCEKGIRVRSGSSFLCFPRRHLFLWGFFSFLLLFFLPIPSSVARSGTKERWSTSDEFVPRQKLQALSCVQRLEFVNKWHHLFKLRIKDSLVTNPQNNQLLVGLLAHLVEHWTSIA